MMEIKTGFPFHGKDLDELRSFLAANALKYDEQIDFSLCLVEDNKIAASGSLDGNVLKCIAVSKDFQNEGLAARIVSGLIDQAARNGSFHLFIFTKPENESLFGGLGFYPLAKTAGVLLMENKKNGITDFVASIAQASGKAAVSRTTNAADGTAKGGTAKSGAAGTTGAIVMNCNPFTNGHQYLIESAASRCDLLYVFVVSENRSAFPSDVRFDLVKAGTAHIPNVRVHPTGPYLISAATFPDYFLKDTVKSENVNTTLDLTIFAEHFAKPLGISRRFVGTEPLDPVTESYNRRMKDFLPRYTIEVVEIERLKKDGNVISAGRVRELLAESRMEEIRELVPPATFAYLKSRRG
ncbi:MAG: adenylyltransferase/cytidyltransferase family protein [Treponema sp.]|jgi:[citrate (pro-3S)-lyase] ligase|nr:adenylyltransferase/cytidyltransferase family protein [Treponema sp.]